MATRYLIRFDDVTPRMNWRVWDRIERLLVRSDVKPILAVVPDNRDPDLDVGDAAADFWSRVRAWQTRGWTIGAHGFQHRFVTKDAGLIGINRYSEFAGLPAHEQESKLRASLAIFAENGVTPDAWIAPAHSFDAVTLDVLAALNLRRISDGFFREPHVDSRGFVWVPQQLWRFKPRRSGVWTVCYHPNGWTENDLARFESDLRAYRDRITDFETVSSEYATRRKSAGDAFFATVYLRYLLALRLLTRWRRAGSARNAAQQ